MYLFKRINRWILQHITSVEMLGVLMRIASFGTVSWLGKDSPFLIVWIVNTIDAILLTWCALLKKDRAYTVLNVFWIGVGMVGVMRAL
jgi:chlorite dismutase